MTPIYSILIRQLCDSSVKIHLILWLQIWFTAISFLSVFGIYMALQFQRHLRIYVPSLDYTSPGHAVYNWSSHSQFWKDLFFLITVFISFGLGYCSFTIHIQKMCLVRKYQKSRILTIWKVRFSLLLLTISSPYIQWLISNG